MTLVGIKFVDKPLSVKAFADLIRSNAEKDVPKLLFNVWVHCIGSDILIINKEFIASSVVDKVFLIMIASGLVMVALWNIWVPGLIFLLMHRLWSIFNTPKFNFWMFKLMLRKNGYKGKVVQL